MVQKSRDSAASMDVKMMFIHTATPKGFDSSGSMLRPPQTQHRCSAINSLLAAKVSIVGNNLRDKDIPLPGFAFAIGVVQAANTKNTANQTGRGKGSIGEAVIVIGEQATAQAMKDANPPRPFRLLSARETVSTPAATATVSTPAAGGNWTTVANRKCNTAAEASGTQHPVLTAEEELMQLRAKVAVLTAIVTATQHQQRGRALVQRHGVSVGQRSSRRNQLTV